MILFIFFFILLYWYLMKNEGDNDIIKYNNVIVFLFFLIIGLRNEAIYNDTYGYVYNFREIQDMSISQIMDRWPKDTFFYILSRILHPFLLHNYTLWLLLIGAVYIFPLGLIVRKYSVNPMYSWTCFIFLGLMMFVMAGLRQAVALGLVSIAFLNLMNNKRVYFFFYVALAYLFHGTSLIFLILYPLRNIPFTVKAFIIYLLSFILLLVMGSTVLSSVISLVGENDNRYLAYGENLQGSTFTYLLQQALLILPSLYILKEKWHEPHVSLFFHAGMIGLLLVSLSPVIAEMFRLSMYFSWANMILFPLAMKEISTRESPLPFIYILFFILYLVVINQTVLQKYYFWFEDIGQII